MSHTHAPKIPSRLSFILAIVLTITLIATPVGAATKTELPGPAGSVRFGADVKTLPSGNFVVSDPNFNDGLTSNTGAVYLFDGATLELISRLTGSNPDDNVGSEVYTLSNGNYLVASPNWDNGAEADAGAVTWCSGTSGCNGPVTSSNSLVGSHTEDYFGNWVAMLSNGDYVVSSAWWDYGGGTDLGAARLCSGMGGCTGPVTPTNSLVGSHTEDYVGNNVFPLSNGDFGVSSPYWDSATQADAGAFTWCSGTSECTGPVTPTNSLVGSQADDFVGYWAEPLYNGNYVVLNPNWDNGEAADAGAVTWCSGTSGCTGPVTTTNSLVGSQVGDMVGYNWKALTNGNYVISSRYWDDGGATQSGAVTWCSGTSGCTGPVNLSNSLTGTHVDDYVGDRVVGLANGNYVVGSQYWDGGGITNVGAATWCSGTSGCTGPVTATNSRVGSQANDKVGSDLVALTNGNYEIGSPDWDNGGTIDAGASTWCSGTSGCTGEVTPANSLVGSHAGDAVGNNGESLTNGNYVVMAPYWDNGLTTDAGAATWCSGTSGCTGEMTPTNSLVGSHAGDQVGDRVDTLPNGSYVVGNRYWDNGGVTDAGASTWCSGTSGCAGPVTPANSLVGSQASDRVGYSAYELDNGRYVVPNVYWANGGLARSGALTWCSATSGCTGPVTNKNSVLGEAALGGSGMNFAYGSQHNQLIVGSPAENKVTVVSLNYWVYLPITIR